MRFSTIDGGLEGPKAYKWREQRDTQLPTPTLASESVTCRLRVVARIVSPRDRIADIKSVRGAITAARAFYDALPVTLRHHPSLENRGQVLFADPLRTGHSPRFEVTMCLGWKGYFFCDEQHVRLACGQAEVAYQDMVEPWIAGGWNIFGRQELVYGYEDPMQDWLKQICRELRILPAMDTMVARISHAKHGTARETT